VAGIHSPELELSALEERLGHRFRNRELLRRALTHTSYAHEAGLDATGHNESLERTTCFVSGVNWVSTAAPSRRVRGQVKIRSRHPGAEAWIEPLPGPRARVEFDVPQGAITPGQAAVFYDGELVLGGGWLERSSDGLGSPDKAPLR